ncbi:tumor necrosis factor receptor [Lynx pardinus]|uniref:Tumor necrosis factor receptor n=1 Tax=Lynx pardinus TaxID=191816 RepID=A0A485MNF9_LYNPA|nr:tumor necrosis factor receptor [Lynx pardinus]
MEQGKAGLQGPECTGDCVTSDTRGRGAGPGGGPCRQDLRRIRLRTPRSHLDNHWSLLVKLLSPRSTLHTSRNTAQPSQHGTAGSGQSGQSTLYLLLLGPLRCSLAAAPCKEEEYPVGAECCPKCGPGYRVQEACGELTGTLCVPCDPGTYTAHLNGLSECLQCRVCDPAMGLVTRRQCSTTENTVCVCDQGHFCVSESGDDCAECRPHTACRPGQRVQQRGTEWQDRVCEDCPPETFSPSGTLEECQPWTSKAWKGRGTRVHTQSRELPSALPRGGCLHLAEPGGASGTPPTPRSSEHQAPTLLSPRCNGPFQSLLNAGTSSSDVKCSSWSLSLFVGLTFSVLLLGGIIPIVVWLLRKRMKTRRSPGGPAKGRLLQVPQAPPDVTTVALEETASVFPGRDQPTDRRL